MKTSLRLSLVLITLCSISHSSFSQLLNFNPPTINGQRPTPLVTPKNTAITITFDNLRVSDPDILVPAYPQGYTLKVLGGDNYTVADATVTPSNNFVGTLTVKVQVNDGKFDSNVFDLKIDVQNDRPQITGQDLLSMLKGESFNVLLRYLKVSDDDNKYPEDFTLTVHDGSNYSVLGNTVTPEATFSGTLKVIVSVNDGHDDSDKFELKIEVKKENEPPVITGYSTLTTNEDQPITIAFGDLTVVDSDNSYPKGFKIKVRPGNNYQVSGANTVNPVANFYGTLTVPVVVNDGIDDSAPYDVIVNVISVNDKPFISGQDPNPLQIYAETSTLIEISSLIVTDPDKQTLTLKILAGSGYSVSGQRITTAPGAPETINVRVVVNDGIVDSEPFDLKIKILPQSKEPVITGQQSLVINEDETITLEFDHISVTDLDDQDYPTGFTMKVTAAGQDYSYDGLTITPKKNFNGLLVVPVQVHDGKNPSNVFPLKIYVLPINDGPEIITMETETIPYEPGTGPITLTTTFTSHDNDSEYLSYAEIKIPDSTFSPLNDVLLFEDTELIRGIYDRQNGILSLIGYATTVQYDSAIRSIKYNYILTEDEQGNQTEVLPGSKYFYFSLSDGALTSDPRSRVVSIETSVLLDIPNAFTPNGPPDSDTNPNNTWAVRPLTSSNQFDKAIIKVYNKRGLLVYESKGFEKRWDGSFNGEVLPVDTYYYTIDLRLTFTKKTYKGTVMILR